MRNYTAIIDLRLDVILKTTFSFWQIFIIIIFLLFGKSFEFGKKLM